MMTIKLIPGCDNYFEPLGITDKRKTELLILSCETIKRNVEEDKSPQLLYHFEDISKQCNNANELGFIMYKLGELMTTLHFVLNNDQESCLHFLDEQIEHMRNPTITNDLQQLFNALK